MNSNRHWDQLRDKASRAFAEGSFHEARDAMDQVVASNGVRIEDWVLAGQILIKHREYARAIEVLQNGLQVEPDHVAIQYEKAVALFHLGNVSAAIDTFERLAKETGLFTAWKTLATIIPGCPNSDNARVFRLRKEFVERLLQVAARDRETVADHRSSQIEHIEQSASNEYSPIHLHDRPIRVGYISAFFRSSNYMKPVWAMINGHNRERFQIELFADDDQYEPFPWLDPESSDMVHFTSGLDNVSLGNLIRDRSLDIVVDLNAYSVASRLGLFTQRLAPVVAAWFNMYATSALPYIDWIVGDPFVIPAEEQLYYTERVYRLPQCYLGFVVGHETPDIVPPPCTRGETFTFGSLVSQYKISPDVLDSWSEILLRVEKSRLLLANRAMQSIQNQQYLLGEFARRGVASDRLRLLPPADHFDYLKYYDQIDVALDAFPYNGGTTTTEAIWQGVPVFAFDGDRWAARTSRTLLMNCHLQEFVAANRRDWVELAVRWGNATWARERLCVLRASMRENLLKSDVCQMPRMVHAMEEFYQSVVV